MVVTMKWQNDRFVQMSPVTLYMLLTCAPVWYLANPRDVLLSDWFLDLNLEDEGMYTCVVENQFGKKEVSAYLSITGIGLS